MRILEFLRTKEITNKVLEFFKNKKFTNKQILNIFASKSTVKNDYYDSIIKVKQGDNSAKKNFIDRHRSFILETISHCLGKSAIPRNSPEYDVGMEAFEHAIDLFNPDKDRDFLLFSEQIIKEWVLSYIREKSSKNSHNQINQVKYYLYSSYESTKDISQFKRNLWEYGIKLGDLPYFSPVEKQNIGVCVRIAKYLATNNELFQKVANNKSLSLDDFNERINIEKRLFNKHKKYIIALTLIIKNNLQLLCSYIKNVNLRNDFSENIGVILEIKNEYAILFTLQCEFLTIKLNTKNKVGEQIKFGSYRIQKKNKNQKYIVAAWAFTSALLVFILINSYNIFMHNYKPTVSYNNSETPLPSVTSDQKNSTDIVTIVPESTPATSFTNTPKKTSTSLASEPLSSKLPATNPIVSTKTSKPTPLQSGITSTPSQSANISPSATIVITKAKGKPDEARISVHPPKVKVGEKYEVHFYMKKGNNGTTLILYQNEQEYKRYDLVDRTPNAQARILSFDATKSGTYNYRWELTNEFGTTSSKTVTVTVLE